MLRYAPSFSRVTYSLVQNPRKLLAIRTAWERIAIEFSLAAARLIFWSGTLTFVLNLFRTHLAVNFLQLLFHPFVFLVFL
jgi:hypothetical protein